MYIHIYIYTHTSIYIYIYTYRYVYIYIRKQESVQNAALKLKVRNILQTQKSENPLEHATEFSAGNPSENSAGNPSEKAAGIHNDDFQGASFGNPQCCCCRNLG